MYALGIWKRWGNRNLIEVKKPWKGAGSKSCIQVPIKVPIRRPLSILGWSSSDHFDDLAFGGWESFRVVLPIDLPGTDVTRNWNRVINSEFARSTKASMAGRGEGRLLPTEPIKEERRLPPRHLLSRQIVGSESCGEEEGRGPTTACIRSVVGGFSVVRFSVLLFYTLLQKEKFGLMIKLKFKKSCL